MNTRWMLTILPAAALIAAAVTQSRAPAEQTKASASKIAVVDIVKVFNSYEQTKKLNELFDQKRESIKLEADKRRDVILGKRKNLESYKPDHPDYKALSEEAVRLEIDMKVWLQVMEQEIKDKHKFWLQKTYENICDVVATTAAKRGFELALTYEEINAAEIPDSNALRQQIVRRNVIYAAAQVDLTDEVLNELNLKFKSSGGLKIDL
jgi:Skp family chaperone for outer membrane proteins